MQRVLSRFWRAVLTIYRFVVRPDIERVRAVILHEHHILLVQHVGGDGLWTLPGGGVHRGEDHVAALEREIYEELRIELASTLFLVTIFDAQRFHTQTAHCYQATAHKTDIEPLRREILAARWFPFSDLPPVSTIATGAITHYMGKNRT